MPKCVYTGTETARQRADGAPALSEPALRRIFARDKARLAEIESEGFGEFGPDNPRTEAPRASSPKGEALALLRALARAGSRKGGRK